MSAPFGRRLIVTTIAAILAIPAFFLVARAITAWKQGYDWAEMDWDDKGYTSMTDCGLGNKCIARISKPNQPSPKITA